MTSTLTQYEYDRLELALQNSKPNWQESPNKRVLQLAFEEIENLRAAAHPVQIALTKHKFLRQAGFWIQKYPRSSKAKRVFAYALNDGTAQGGILAALQILGRVANVVRPDGTEEHV